MLTNFRRDSFFNMSPDGEYLCELDQEWMAAAYSALRCSHDPRHKVGCSLVAPDGRHLVGANSIPGKLSRSVPGRLDGPDKDRWTCDAAVKLICNAARIGIATAGARLYSTEFPSEASALIIIAAGVVEIISPPADFIDALTGESLQRAEAKFKEAGIIMRQPHIVSGAQA